MFRLRGYVKDYEIQVKKDKTGKESKVAVYIGPWYRRSADEEMNRRLKRIYITMSVLIVLVFIGCGFVENAGNRNMINALAYACSCFPVVYNIIGLVAVLRLGERIERREYDMSLRRMKHSAVGIMMMYPIAVITEIVSLFTVDKEINIPTEILYLLLCGLMCLCAWLIWYLCRKYPYREEKKLQAAE